jgi:hypothetical protein
LNWQRVSLREKRQKRIAQLKTRPEVIDECVSVIDFSQVNPELGKALGIPAA